MRLGGCEISHKPCEGSLLDAVINGLLAPFLLVAILVIASDKKLMPVPTEFTLGMDRRGDRHGSNAARPGLDEATGKPGIS